MLGKPEEAKRRFQIKKSTPQGVPLDQLIKLIRGFQGQIPSQRSLDLLIELHGRLPDDLNVAKALISQLQQLESVSLLDTTLTQCVERFNDPSLYDCWILSAMAWGEASTAQERIDLAIKSCGNRLSFLRHKVDALIAQKRFDLAISMARSIEKAAFQPEIKQEFRDRLKKISTQAAITAAWGKVRSSNHPGDYEIYYINMDRDIHRAQRMERQLGSWNVSFERISAVRGSLLPGVVSAELTRGDSTNMKGTLGCFLSHVYAWEKCLESDLNFALILEDDAKFLLPPPPSVAAICKESFDILFVNHRMAPAIEEQAGSQIQIKSVKEAVRHKSANWRAAGTDGYFISRRGAKRLIDWVRQDGFWGDIDWRLILYALAKDWQACLPPDSFAKTAVGHHARRCAEREPIRAYVLSPEIIGHHRGGSARHIMNGFKHAHLETKID